MLPKENRLKKKKDFDQVFKKGKGFNEKFLFLKIEKNNLKESRFGFVVSQKISKKAVIRNKIKRRLREITKEKILQIKKGIDGVLIVKPGLEKKTFLEVREITESLFRKANILK